MERPRSRRRSRIVFAVGLFVFLVAGDAHVAGQAGAPAASSRAVEQGSRLFLGQARFQNGGPPCGSCHQLSTLAFPNGGTIGPDLSAAYRTLGEEGTDVTLQTLFFPTMMPLYEGRSLTDSERQALKALLTQGDPAANAAWVTFALAGGAALGFLLLMAITWLAWRRRLRAVRAPLVRSAVAGGARR